MRGCVVVLILSPSLAGLCLASPPCATLRCEHLPATRYVKAPVVSYRQIVFAEAAFLVIDYDVKDVFVFTGPPPAAAPGFPAGIDGRGVEVRAVAGKLGGASAEDDGETRAVVGYVDGRASAARRQGERSTPARLATLEVSCASCHTGAKARGGFVLFDSPGLPSGAVNWKKVKAEVESGRMPPPGSGKPPVSPADRARITTLAGA